MQWEGKEYEMYNGVYMDHIWVPYHLPTNISVKTFHYYFLSKATNIILCTQIYERIKIEESKEKWKQNMEKERENRGGGEITETFLGFRYISKALQNNINWVQKNCIITITVA